MGVTGHRWTHDITIYTREDLEAIRERLGLPAASEPIAFCDDRGVCFFDEGFDPNARVLASILDERGALGWQLVQIDYGRDRLICVWRRPREGKPGDRR
jgi:hypothetical protein